MEILGAHLSESNGDGEPVLITQYIYASTGGA